MERCSQRLPKMPGLLRTQYNSILFYPSSRIPISNMFLSLHICGVTLSRKIRFWGFWMHINLPVQ